MAALRHAACRLAAVLTRPRASAVYRTAPEGGADQPWYLNAAVAGLTTMSPAEALVLARSLEDEAGRTRLYAGAPRTLDVDLVFLGDTVMDEPGLTIPHPRWSDRDFVVVPLLDIVPDLRDPRSGRTVREVARSAGWIGRDLHREADAGVLLSVET
jgi:2-amino-4-hydroxy-6-hydroxymethyldihydropteridine diphosphokinase